MSVFGKQSGGGRRTARRAPTPAVAVITTVTDSHNAMVVDLSETGVRLCSAIAPRLDQSLVITIEAIRAFGTVAWINGNEFGISFDEPIDAAEVAALKGRLFRYANLAPDIRVAIDDWLSGMAR